MTGPGACKYGSECTYLEACACGSCLQLHECECECEDEDEDDDYSDLNDGWDDRDDE